MRPLASWSPENRIALGVLAVSAALLAASAAGARRLDPLPAAPAAPRLAAMPEVAPRGRGGRSEEAILAAVARDPFRADRKRPPGRYRMPGEAVTVPPPVAAPPVAAPPPVYPFELLGTVVAPGGGLAALQGPDGQGRVVRVGQTFEGFRLTRVSHGSATLVGNDTTLVLRTGNMEEGSQ